MKKIMLIGSAGSVKSTLICALNANMDIVKKTQALVYDNRTIDTPGEYLENPMLYRALLSTALETEYVIFTQDGTAERSVFPPGFARAFPCCTIGVVTKIDHKDSNDKKALNFLKELALSGPVFKVSSITDEGIDRLKEVIDWQDK